jgi:hypothetical protein
MTRGGGKITPGRSFHYHCRTAGSSEAFGVNDKNDFASTGRLADFSVRLQEVHVCSLAGLDTDSVAGSVDLRGE